MRWAQKSLRRALTIVGAVALLAWCLLAARAPRSMLGPYLAAYLFFLGPALGGMALVMVHALTGGRWAADLRASLRGSIRTLPLLALLLGPLLLGARRLYPWVSPARELAKLFAPNLARQAWYLNMPFFVARGIACVALWLLLAALLRRSVAGRRGHQALRPGIAAAGLIVYVLTVSVAGTDWVVSLTPAWHSSVFGLTWCTSQMLCAGAIGLAACACKDRDDPERAATPDVAGLVLALLLAWSYLAYAEYLTVWIADLPTEIVWYQPCLQTNWRWLGAWMLLTTAAAFAILLFRRAKSDRRWMLGVSALLLAGQAAYACWLVLPSVRRAGITAHASDALPWLGIGSLWLSIFLGGTRAPA